MKRKHTLRLVDGSFAPTDAATVLTALVDSKINFHKMLLFSNQERFNHDVSHSEKRLEQLKALKREMKEILDYAKANDKFLEIEGELMLKLVSNKTVSKKQRVLV